jgi:hypothetical protein
VTATAVITHIRATVRRNRRILKLSSLLRYSLATAKADPDGKPNLLPTEIPNRCAHDLFRCRAIIGWIVGDGRNHVYLCHRHMEHFWGEGRDTNDFTVERVIKGKWSK